MGIWPDIYDIEDQVNSWTKGLGIKNSLKTGIQDKNAFAHAYSSAQLVYDGGKFYSDVFSEGREYRDFVAGTWKAVTGVKDYTVKGVFLDGNRDEYNNTIGQQIAKYALANGLPRSAVGYLIADALKNGFLISDEGRDPRNVLRFSVDDYTGPSAAGRGVIEKMFGVKLDVHCFIAGTMIDMWPLDPDIRPDANGLFDNAKVLALVWQKPIEEITPADWVVSFDKAGNLQPGKVSRTFNNEAKIILDFFGTGVTPGHVYYRPDSKKAYKFEPLIDILRDDGVIQKGDGTLVRAATNCGVGSEEDRELWAFTVYEDKDGNECIRDKKKLQLGTRWMLPNGNHFSMFEYMQGIGLELLPNGYVRWKQTGLISPFVWTLSDTLPNPEDFVLARSGTTLEDIYKAAEWEAMRPDMPPPMLRDSGPVQPLSQAGLTLMPRNTPLAMREGGSTGMFNRKQRKAAEAEKRQQAKGKKRLVH